MNKTLWVKLSVDYMNDPKIISVGPLGELLFVRALAYAKKNNHPVIPTAVIPRLCVGLETADPLGLARTLVTQRLWDEDDDGFRIAAWDTWQANDTKGQSAGGTLAMHNRWHQHTRSNTCPHCQDDDDRAKAVKKEPKNAMMYLPEVSQSCERLARHMVNNGAKAPIINDGWLTEMEKLHRIDGRPWDEIHNVIDWCQRDPFWRTNILSPAKLRKQYDQLKLKMVAPVRRDNNEAEQAWTEVQMQVRLIGYTGSPTFTTDRIRETVRTIGWRNICQAQPEIMKRQFTTTYNNQGNTD